MKASPADQRLLLDLQGLDNQSRQLAYAREHLAETDALATLQAKLSETSSDFIARQGAVEDAQREIDRIEDDIAVVKARRESDTQREATSSSVKDVQALEAEIASLTVRLENLEEMELEVMERLELAEASLAELHAGRASILDEITAAESARNERVRAIEAELAAVSEQRVALAHRIPADLLGLYEKQRDRYGIGAALLTRGMSGGSGMALSESDLAKIRATPDDDVVMCPDSNCILVRTEESGL